MKKRFESYLRKNLPNIFEINSNNDACIINKEYECISLSTESLNTPEIGVNRTYSYNDGCKPWDNIENFQTVLSKLKELKQINEVVKYVRYNTNVIRYLSQYIQMY